MYDVLRSSIKSVSVRRSDPFLQDLRKLISHWRRLRLRNALVLQHVQMMAFRWASKVLANFVTRPSQQCGHWTNGIYRCSSCYYTVSGTQTHWWVAKISQSQYLFWPTLKFQLGDLKRFYCNTTQSNLLWLWLHVGRSAAVGTEKVCSWSTVSDSPAHQKWYDLQ